MISTTTKFLVVAMFSFSTCAFAEGVNMSAEDAPALPTAEAPAPMGQPVPVAKPEPVKPEANKPEVKREVAKQKSKKAKKSKSHKKLHAKKSSKSKTKRF